MYCFHNNNLDSYNSPFSPFPPSSFILSFNIKLVQILQFHQVFFQPSKDSNQGIWRYMKLPFALAEKRILVIIDHFITELLAISSLFFRSSFQSCSAILGITCSKTLQAFSAFSLNVLTASSTFTASVSSLQLS